MHGVSIGSGCIKRKGGKGSGAHLWKSWPLSSKAEMEWPSIFSTKTSLGKSQVSIQPENKPLGVEEKSEVNFHYGVMNK